MKVGEGCLIATGPGARAALGAGAIPKHRTARGSCVTISTFWNALARMDIRGFWATTQQKREHTHTHTHKRTLAFIGKIKQQQKKTPTTQHILVRFFFKIFDNRKAGTGARKSIFSKERQVLVPLNQDSFL